MRIHLGITDNAWCAQLAGMARRGGLEEVNFWRPSNLGFQALQPGEIFLFKLHAPNAVVAGGGIMTRTAHLPVRLAWEAFGAGNGVTSEPEMLERIRRYRKGHSVAPGDRITCIVLSEPFFFAPGKEIAVPASFARGIQTGKTYDTDEIEGRTLYAAVQERLRHAAMEAPGPAVFQLREGPRVGPPIAVFPRLGQGGFRVSITEAYRRRCAMTGEKTMPALDAAHIRPYSDGGGHELSNGLLLRRDLHRLFDLGYLSVNPDDRRIVVSGRIKTEFENGRDYYALHGRAITPPADALALPSAEAIRYHAEHVFRG